MTEISEISFEEPASHRVSSMEERRGREKEKEKRGETPALFF
jgi:hypothetical protein